MIKKFLVYFIIALLMAFPVSAADVNVNRWIYNITLNEDGDINELIQAEIQNNGASPLEGISFVVPASNIEVIYDFDHTFSSIGQTVEQQPVNNGIRLTVKFNTSIKSGETWNGRIGFRALNMAKKTANEYSIEMPVDTPQAIISGKSTPANIPQDAEIRGQFFLPKGIEVISVTPKPFRILFQNSLMVPTWTPQNLHANDVINLKGSFSETLKKIADVDERSKKLAKQIKDAKSNGMDVSEAETHLLNAENYNTNNENSALSSFWKKDEKAALDSVSLAESEIDLAENSFASSGRTETESNQNSEETESQETPGFNGIAFILTVCISFMIIKRNRV